MTLTLFQGKKYVRIINSKLVLDSCSVQFKQYMVATHIKKIKHSMLCVTGVYLRHNTIEKKKLHFNVKHLSICSSCEETHLHMY